MNHNCKGTEPLLSGYLDGELTQSDRQRVELILEDCEHCTLAFEEIKQLRQKVGGISYEKMTETERREMIKKETSGAAASVGQVLALVGLILVYGFGAYWLCVEVITDAKFARTGDLEDKVPLFLKIGLPTLFVGLGVLFFTVLFQRMKVAKTDKYKDVQI